MLLQCEDGADVDSWRSLQDHLLSDEQKPGSVLALRFGADLYRRGHPAAGPSLQPTAFSTRFLVFSQDLRIVEQIMEYNENVLGRRTKPKHYDQ